MTTLRRQPRFNPPTPVEMPADVRWLNITASVLFAGAVLLLLSALVVWALRQPVFSIRSVRVEGEVSHNNVPTIRANAMPQLSGNFFTLSLAKAQHAFQAVPWVRQAVVRRVWPNRLVVQLEEHRPVAFWEAEDKSERLVNSFGEVFDANLGDVEDDGLPTLKGPDETSAQMLAVYRRLVPVFEPLDLSIDALTQSGRGSWHVEFDGGAEVELGRGTEDELIARTERFVQTVTQVIERYQRPLVYADLRHNEGYALRLKGVTTTFTKPAQAGRN
jgi:cell division protein FtsQ